MVPVTLDAATTDVLDRLGDLDNKVWTRAEVKLYLQDGYDQFCTRTKVLFDTYVIENLPPVANWQTDLEKYFAQQRSGWGITDEKFHYTDSSEQDNGVAGAVGGSYSGPSGMTSPGDRDFAATVDGSAGGVPTAVKGGTLPQSVVRVARVAWNRVDLQGLTAARLRQIDPIWEDRTGDPQWFVHDSDGLFYLRVVPAANGGATYTAVDGSWGSLAYTDDSTVTVVTREPDGYDTGGFGILVASDGFPSHGPWGTITRIHPDDDNIKVEVFRLGLPLTEHPFELPFAYQKYVLYWAMSQLLRREGPGQDIALADHYAERFEMGVQNLARKRDRMANEREGAFGAAQQVEPFGIGDPQAPYPYGIPY